jgi:hypothetical protein
VILTLLIMHKECTFGKLQVVLFEVQLYIGIGLLVVEQGARVKEAKPAWSRSRLGWSQGGLPQCTCFVVS